jgi:two-component system, response regulator PdtaR
MPAGTILVVEDQWLVRAEIARELEKDGWEVLEAGTVQRAFEHLNNRPAVQALFTDIQLGGELSGWDVAEAFRSRFPLGRVVYTSGNSIDPNQQLPSGISNSSVTPRPPARISAAFKVASDGRSPIGLPRGRRLRWRLVGFATRAARVGSGKACVANCWLPSMPSIRISSSG